jgi:hypothetical protein
MRRVYETIVAVEKQEVLHISVCVRVRGALWRVRTHAHKYTLFYKTRAIFVYKTIPTMVRFLLINGHPFCKYSKTGRQYHFVPQFVKNELIIVQDCAKNIAEHVGLICYTSHETVGIYSS